MSNEKKYVHFLTYGCQMNFSDAERMEGELAKIGYEYTDTMAKADLIMINTCCVRETAEDKVYGKIGEIKGLKRKNPDLILGITGCMAQKEGEKLIKRAPHIDFVLGTNKIAEVVNTVKQIESANVKHVVDTEIDINDVSEEVAIHRKTPLSAWVPIMYGCNNFCTYCIVPYVRGRERSRLPEAVVKEVQEAAKDGFKEVTLLGQNVNSYGKDHQKATFAELLKLVDEVEGIERVRYMTSHPKDLSDEVIEVIKNSKHICKHFHLPVQYGSNRILKAMNRVYTVESYRELVAKIRQAVPDCSLTTDLIVGFPGETEEDFQQLLEFLKEIRYDQAYTFIYSKRSGTPAAEMENQVEDAVKHQRLNKLMEVQNQISLEINQTLVGKTLEVMAEGPSQTDDQVWTGRTSTNKILLWPYKGQEKPGDLVKVKVTHAQTWLLKGELAE
ncbi:MAG: tRNA (N6-isopentenyl adenosine(37)-C2)-methylthiotransferase MiaB [Selenomonadaceae bacterium]|nr:tRNA (N6-isopentenyl adenosine(37)-C2)-methylthiotransferase MiaB [Selenomonadaceae bacterium]